MTPAPEPAYAHGSPARTAVLLVNLGTPDEPTPAALRRYLAEFLSDTRVVEIPRLVWLPLLHGIILRVRPAKSAQKYASIWTPEGSPLAAWTRKQTQLLAEALGAAEPADGAGAPASGLLLRHAMRYGSPSIRQVLDELRAAGATRILVLPLYPQYAAATTASVNDEVMRWALTQRRQPELRFVNHYHDHPGYIAALANQVREHRALQGPAQKLVLSFHGVPQRSLQLGDNYHCECHKTARLLREALGLSKDEVVVTFQSRFGKARWLEPYTEPTLIELAKAGVRTVDVMCPGFVADCLETLEEIDQEAREAFLEAGGTSFRYIRCLNDQPDWITALADVARQHLQGWPGTGLDQNPTSASTESSPAPSATLAPPPELELRLQRELALALGAQD